MYIWMIQAYLFCSRIYKGLLCVITQEQNCCFTCNAKSQEMELPDIVNRLRSHMICAVCLETLSSPKLLVCGHRFCATCLPRADTCFPKGLTHVTCPICRTARVYPADRLPNDCLAANFKEEMQHLEYIARAAGSCMVCSKTGLKLRCLTCQISLCEECHIDHFSVHHKNHAVVKADTSILCDKHETDLCYVCEHCHKLVCSCCLLDECKGHRYLTVRDAIDEYFKMKDWTERNTEFTKNNYTTLKDKLQSTFSAVSTNIQKHSDDAIEAIKKETRLLIESLDKMESDALNILENTKIAADALKEFSEVQSEKCGFEIPLELLKNLPHLLRPEVQTANDNCILDKIVFKPNKNISIGSVHVSLSKPESNTLDCTLPRLYGSQMTTTNLCTTRAVRGDVRKVVFILNPMYKKSKRIASLFPDDVLLSLRYLFATEHWCLCDMPLRLDTDVGFSISFWGWTLTLILWHVYVFGTEHW